MATKVECLLAVVAEIAFNLCVETLQPRFGNKSPIDVSVRNGIKLQILPQHNFECFTEGATGGVHWPVAVEKALCRLAAGLRRIAPFRVGVADETCKKLCRLPGSAGGSEGGLSGGTIFEFSIIDIFTRTHISTSLV